MNFITPAYAQSIGGGSTSDLVMQMAPFGVILIIMYFLIMRPQQRKAKEHQDLIKNVRRGDTVITSGGLIGKISRTLDDNEIEIEIAPNVKVRQLRHMITDVRAKGEPVKETSERKSSNVKEGQ
jgi:preprotein translocase subunit YajC